MSYEKKTHKIPFRTTKSMFERINDLAPKYGDRSKVITAAIEKGLKIIEKNGSK